MYLAILAIAAAAEAVSAMLMLRFRDMLHVIMAFSVFLIFNSAISLMLQQPLLAILQLFIMVGGVATFAFVGTASAGISKFSSSNMAAFAAIAVIISALMFYPFSMIGAQSGGMQNVFSAQSALPYMQSDVSMFYVITAILFGIGFGSIIVMGRGARK